MSQCEIVNFLNRSRELSEEANLIWAEHKSIRNFEINLRVTNKLKTRNSDFWLKANLRDLSFFFLINMSLLSIRKLMTDSTYSSAFVQMLCPSQAWTSQDLQYTFSKCTVRDAPYTRPKFAKNKNKNLWKQNSLDYIIFREKYTIKPFFFFLSIDSDLQLSKKQIATYIN